MKKNYFISVILVWGLFSVSSVHSAEVTELDDLIQQAIKATPNLENGLELYRNCAICHSPEGWGSTSGRYPQIAGQHKSVIIKQLEDIHQGNRDNPTMEPFVRPILALGSQALADLAAYISQLPMSPNNSIGPGYKLDEGQVLYEKNCKQCHKSNGEGVADKFYPRVQGQHFSYIKRQLFWIKKEKRRNADEEMVSQLKDFSVRDIDLIADYTSRLRPDKSVIAESKYWKNPDFRNGFSFSSGN
ncbi:MAG: c-type cytochrome [Gammaproteobacteria bacterium]|nr:c-type cytochrome [Gammaproteobacteria bacterium]